MDLSSNYYVTLMWTKNLAGSAVDIRDHVPTCSWAESAHWVQTKGSHAVIPAPQRASQSLVSPSVYLGTDVVLSNVQQYNSHVGQTSKLATADSGITLGNHTLLLTCK